MAPAGERTEGNYTVERSYDPPKTAIVGGRLVKVASQGNSEGHSPAWQIIDQGKPRIVAFDEPTFIDLDMLAPSTEQVLSLLSTLKR